MTFKLKMPQLHEYQQMVAQDPARFKYLSCGRRWGKTIGCASIAVRAAFYGQRGWWVAPTYQIASLGWREARGLAVKINPVISTWGFPPIEIKEGAMTLLFPSGGSLVFKSSDVPDNLRGEGLDFLIMDEADFQPEIVWEDILRPALSDRQGWAIFISTPNNEGSWFHRNYLKGMPGNPPDVPFLNAPFGERPEIKSWQFSSYTNPKIEDSEIDAAKEDIPSIVFRREYLGEFVSSAGARIQRDWLKDRYFSEKPSGLQKVVVGVDLAVSEKASADWNACVAIGRHKNGDLYVLDADRMRGSFYEIATFCKNFADRNGVTEVAVEDVAAQKWMVQELSRDSTLTVRGVHSDKDKFARFAPLESRYEKRQVWHRRDLPRAFEAELFSFGASPEHDDFVDAMSAAWKMLAEPTKIRASPRTVVFGNKGFKGVV